MSYKATIGLEIHAELKTSSKMFCVCAHDPDAPKQNSNICPVCTGQPGSLPRLNVQAIKNVIKVGLAVGGTIANYTEWDRKHYFYPDIPKGYQISQYKYPLVTGGSIHGVDITRIHLEEDTGKSLHIDGEGSLVDYNRAGAPLMELVTEPVIRDAKQAGDFARELQLILRTLGVAEANMEKGEMRVEANISVNKTETFGTKTEVKNLNSFRSVERAIEYEIARQIAVLEKGEKVIQETRGYDESKGTTFTQRKKESSHDYRYFPDPDIRPFRISENADFNLDVLSRELPELPDARRARYEALGLKKEDIETLVYNLELGTYFEQSIANVSHDKAIVKLIFNYINTDYVGLLKKMHGESFALHISQIKPENIGHLGTMISEQKINSRSAKEILKLMYDTGSSPMDIAVSHGLLIVNDPTKTRKVVDDVLGKNDKAIQDYKTGKGGALEFIVGQIMKETRGSAKPDEIRKIITEIIG